MAENILINFEVDYTGLQPAIDQLEQLGAVDKNAAAAFRATNTELAKRTQQLGSVSKTAQQAGTVTKKSIDELDKSVLKLTNDLVQGMREGVTDALKEAGVSAQEFSAALKTGNTEVAKSSETVRSRLREITQELALMKARGEDNTAQYRALTAEAGNLTDALGDVSQEIRGAAADSQLLEGTIGIVQGLAGGFAAVQGAAALFGNESEELQEVLLRVNATMAILQGLQQVNTVLQKESAASKAADIIVTKAQTAAQVVFATVVGTSTGALRAFRIALAATGVGLLVLALGALVAALSDTADEMEDVNRILERNKQLIDEDANAIKRRTDLEVARAQAAGKAESDLTRIRGRGLQEQRAALLRANQELATQRDTLNATTKEYGQLNERIQENADAIRDIDVQTQIEALQLQRQLSEEAKKAAEERKRLAEEAAQRERELRDQQLQDQLAALDRQLLAAQNAGTETLRIEQAIISKKAELDLNAENLTANQIKLIRERAAADQLALAKKNAAELSAIALEGLIAQNTAALQQLNLAAEERLRLQEDNIITAAQLEVNAAEGNAARIIEIEARRDAQIRDNRQKTIQEAVNYEIQLQQARSGAYLRENERIASDAEAATADRFAAIDELTNYELAAINQQQDALNRQLQEGLISRRDYNLQYEQLVDQAEQATEASEKRKTEITKAEEQRRREEVQRTIDFTIETAQQVVGLLQELFAQQADAELVRVDEQRKQIEDLRESGAITEKEAQARLKRLDQEERRIKQQQAQRDKQIAIFNAIINTAQAITRALATGGPVFAAIVAALGAAQIALIASRPIPKFGKGKKGNYEGLGEVGETGSELVESNGQLYIAPKRTIVWLGAKDKVYNPQETKAMLDARGGSVKALKPGVPSIQQTGIDYDKLGKVIAKNTPGLSLNIDGYKDFVIQGHAFNTYLKNRRSY